MLGFFWIMCLPVVEMYTCPFHQPHQVPKPHITGEMLYLFHEKVGTTFAQSHPPLLLAYGASFYIIRPNTPWKTYPNTIWELEKITLFYELAHFSTSVYLALVYEPAFLPLKPIVLESLHRLRAQTTALHAQLQQYWNGTELAYYMHYVNLTSSFVNQVVEHHQYDATTFQSYLSIQAPFNAHLLSQAALLLTDRTIACLRPILAEFTPQETTQFYFVMSGNYSLRKQQQLTAILAWMLQLPPTSDRFLFFYNIHDLQEAYEMALQHLIDLDIGSTFLHSPTGFQQDVLLPATLEYLQSKP